MTATGAKARLVLVTGATRGLGYAASLALARSGAHVIALGRTQGGLEDLDDAISALGAQSTLVPMDVTDFAGIERLGHVIKERWGRLDGLYANAAILGDITPVPVSDPKMFDDVINVNLTANHRLIRICDPLLRASHAGRAVFVSSGVASSRRAFWGPYAAAKSGLEALVQCYADEIKQSSVRVNILNPGAVRTAMRAKAMPGEDTQLLPSPQDVAPLIVKMLSAEFTDNAQIVSFRETSYYDKTNS